MKTLLLSRTNAIKTIGILIVFIQLIINPLYGQLLTEDFESGNLPSSWTEENIEGAVNWQFNNGGIFSKPSSAHNGNFNAYFRIIDANNVTKLITPKITFGLYTTEPTLSFWYSLPQYSGHSDILKIYYKNSDNGEWTLLKELNETSDNWTQLTLSLPNLTDNYYIAFEGNSYPNEHGISIDDVEITAKLTCTAPNTQASNFQISAIDNNSAIINWTSGDGQEILIVAKEGNAVDASPASGTSYAANQDFEAGDEIGSDNFVVYKGSDNFANINELHQSTNYHFALYEYNTTEICYNLTPLTDNILTSGPIANLQGVAQNKQISLNFTAPEGATDVQLFYKSKENNYSEINTDQLDETSTSTIVDELINGTTYTFKLVVTGGRFAGNSNEFIATANNYVSSGSVMGTWTKDQSPYIITGDIEISAGTALNIEPEVEIIFDGNYSLTVKGSLTASGNENEKIIFTASENQKITGWQGIKFNYTTSASILSNCKFEYGKGDKGGAIYINGATNLNINNSLITNSSSSSGGGIFIINASPTISNNIFTNNASSLYGGAISLENSNAIISNNYIYNNSAFAGGAICLTTSMPFVSENLICNNNATVGGGLYLSMSDAILYNNTICNNQGQSGGGIYLSTSKPTIYNSIIWGNIGNGEQFFLDEASETMSPKFYNCNIQGGKERFVSYNGEQNYDLDNNSYTNNSNIDSDPLFIKPSIGAGIAFNDPTADWKLQNSSPCINTGKSDVSEIHIGITDFYSNKRISFGNIDIGNFEYPNSPPTAIIISPSAIDENLAIGSIACQISAIDPDLAIGDTFIYTFTTGVDFNGKFTISGNDLIVSNSLNNQGILSYNISLIAIDFDGNSISDKLTLNINSKNATPTSITIDNTVIKETLTIGSTIGTLTTTDTDIDDFHTYTLGDAEDNLSFRIEDDKLKSNAEFDYTTQNSYTIQIETKDTGNKLFTQEFIINITEDIITRVNNLTQSNLQIFPNPSNGLINIKSSNINLLNNNFKLSIYNSAGKLIKQSENYRLGTTIDMSLYKKGIYFINLKNINTNWNSKITIQN